MRKIIFFIIGVLLIGAAIGYFYLYQDHRNISQEEASFELSAQNLADEFKNDAVSANTKYLNQTIEVKGIVKEVTDSTLLLESGVFCSLNEKANESLNGKEITIKGRCIGFDELFGEVKLDQCSLK